MEPILQVQDQLNRPTGSQANFSTAGALGLLRIAIRVLGVSHWPSGRDPGCGVTSQRRTAPPNRAGGVMPRQSWCDLQRFLHTSVRVSKLFQKNVNLDVGCCRGYTPRPSSILFYFTITFLSAFPTQRIRKFASHARCESTANGVWRPDLAF